MQTIGRKNKRAELKQIWDSLVSMFTFRRPGQKLYVTFTRRMQLINQVRDMKRRSEKEIYEQRLNNMRDRLNMQYK